ncbi:hypothetical protein H7992_04875 [Sporosarcina sp. resist]|uniref:hypothetical protein n=1 Tax=Sporosarcina sp. resist TaxID=2762563 RepID=UPI00164D31F5|nr:hypothetical protein [Sporosarcina sp. resist]QNK89061.1 hypothetical protein H7992_04875 [Sporosarcina sp. resist]
MTVDINGISPSYFLSEFDRFDIEVSENTDYLFKLSKCVGDVEFNTIMTASEIVDLKNTMPDKWEYIQLQLQRGERDV